MLNIHSDWLLLQFANFFIVLFENWNYADTGCYLTSKLHWNVRYSEERAFFFFFDINVIFCSNTTQQSEKIEEEPI